MILRDEIIFWGVWIIIPLIWEIGVGFLSGVHLITSKFMFQNRKTIEHYPTISVLIPIYNSSATLEACLQSIANQNYDLDKIEVRLLNNHPNRDESYEIYNKFAMEYPHLKTWWYDTHAGKAKALNRGINSSKTEFIVNIDSDGWLDREGLKSIVLKFESDSRIGALTGVVLIDPKLIKQTRNIPLQMGQRCEMLEYAESFLVGRNISSKFNAMYTLAGACSAFRRSSLLKTNMYNFDTVGEDTDMTFKIKTFAKKKALLCVDCFFYVDPIESIDRMYTQRQRWQRGQLEVAHLYKKLHTGHIWDFFSNESFRILTSDHTLAFPRLIWIFGTIYLYFVGYPLRILIGSNFILYLLYVFNSALYLGVSLLYTQAQKETQAYLKQSWWLVPLMPLYRGAIYWMRLAGVVNSIDSSATWTTLTLTKEIEIIKQGLKKSVFNRYGHVKKLLEERLNEKPN